MPGISNFLIAYRDALKLLPAYDSNEQLTEFFIGRRSHRKAYQNVETLIKQIYIDLWEYPALSEAAKHSLRLRRSLIFAYATFGTETRKNSPEQMIHHTLRNAEKTLMIFRHCAVNLPLNHVPVNPIIKVICHDTREDGGIKDGPIRLIFGADIADGVDRETVKRERSEDWRIDIRLKKTAKTTQAVNLLPDELVGTIIDTLDDPWTNDRDFKAGWMRIDGQEVFYRHHEGREPIEKVKATLDFRGELHLENIARLRAKGLFTVDGVTYDGVKAADLLEPEFDPLKLSLNAHLNPAPTTKPTRNTWPQAYKVTLEKIAATLF